MTTENHSSYNASDIPSPDGLRFGIAVSEWNREITGALEQGACETLLALGVPESDIRIVRVPGSFELPLAGQYLAATGNFDAIILLGCVIRGETAHFDYICQGVTQGTMELNLKFNIPFIFGVLTTENHAQARARAGGKLGNKGIEAAIAAVEMAVLKKNI
jgi:6,7-dimethyl-8-ribityllumazine synthase